MSPSQALLLELDDVRWHQQDSPEAPVLATITAEISELRRRPGADPSWWTSLWRHLIAILHGQLLAGVGGDTRARSPRTDERAAALEDREHG